MNWYDANGNGSTTPAGRRGTDSDAMNGNAVMFDAGKILTVGGSPSYVNSVATSHANLVRANPLVCIFQYVGIGAGVRVRVRISVRS